MVFNLFTESVCQTSKASHAHPHREIVPLVVTRADVVGVRIADGVAAEFERGCTIEFQVRDERRSRNRGRGRRWRDARARADASVTVVAGQKYPEKKRKKNREISSFHQ